MNEFTTVAAGIAGGLLTALGAYVNDRVRSRDQRRTRWDSSKVEIYVGFSEAVEAGLAGLIHIADCNENGQPYWGQDLQALRDVYRQSKDRLRAHLGRVRLVAGPDLREIGEALSDKIKELQNLEAGGARSHDGTFKELEHALRQHIDEFQRTAALELGIDSAKSPRRRSTEPV